MTATADHAAAVSYGVTLSNDGPFPRTEWREVGIPTAIADRLTAGAIALALRTDDPTPQRVYLHPGRRLPDTCFFWARVTVPARTVLHWRVVQTDLGTGDLGTDPAMMHPYVDDDVRALLPSFELVDVNGVMRTLEATGMAFEVLELTQVRNVYRLRGFIPGTPVHVTVNAYLYDMQAHVRLEVFVGLGGTTIGREVVSYAVRSLVMKCGESIAIQHKQRCGVTDLTRDAAGKWCVLLSGPRSIGRAEQLPFFGWMLCLPSHANAMHYPDVETNFRGIVLGGTCAMTFESWDGHFGALRVVPVLPQSNGGWPAANIANAVHKAAQSQRGDLYDQRPMGLAKYAGQTGSQEDFAAGQDLLALRVADPRRQDELQFSAHGFFLRPFHNRDDSARPILFRDHTACRTWSQVPERRVGSGDSLGWPPNLPNSYGCSGYTKIDDQHRSQEIITCWGHLVDSYAITQLLQDFAQMDLGQAMVDQDRVEAPRAEGRLLGAWADMLGLMPPGTDRAELEAHATRRLNILDRSWIGRGLPDGRVRPLLLGTNPEIQQHQVPVVVSWEHSIAAMGLYAWWKRTGSNVAYELCRHTCEMVVQFGIFEWEDDWWCALAFQWQADGVPLPASEYRPGSPKLAVGAGDWWTWMLPAVLILAHEWPNSPHAARARACLRSIYGTGPKTEVEAEWWAVVPHRDWSSDVRAEPEAVEAAPAPAPAAEAAVDEPAPTPAPIAQPDDTAAPQAQTETADGATA